MTSASAYPIMLLRLGVHELTVSDTRLLDISLRKLPQLFRDLKGGYLGYGLLRLAVFKFESVDAGFSQF